MDHLTRSQIVVGVVAHVIGAVIVVLVAAGVLSPWFLL
jgi:hypothetical protein